jgi:peptide-methionine (R)-S-oxide reductase
MQRLKATLRSLPRNRVVAVEDNYLHAEFTSRLFRFVDDVEFYVDEEQHEIHFRSASRVGYSDLGANRKRMELIAAAFEQVEVAVDDVASSADPGIAIAQEQQAMADSQSSDAAKSLPQTDAEWKEVLTPEQYRVTRQHGTEQAFTGEFWDCKKQGTYECVCCGLPLFDSRTKFDSGTGWPSFWKPIEDSNVGTQVDDSLFMRRTEVHCRRCGAHLGHVFDDGPQPTGLRYCINSVCLTLDEQAAE